MKSRSASVFDSAWCTECAQPLLRGRLEASWGCPGEPFGRFLAALGPPRAPQDRSQGHFFVPKAVLSAPRRVSETTWGAQNCPKSILRRFFTDLGSIFFDFRMIFRRCSFEPLATKAQNRSLKNESREFHQTSWLLRCAVASYRSYVFRNDFRTLHVQLFSLRTHKTT